jgi:hypothetical protein
MPGLENGSSLANAFTWDPTQYPGGTRVFGATSYNQSQDWWALYLLAGKTYVFQSRLPTTWSHYLYLYDSNGSYLAGSSSGGDDGYPLSKLTYTPQKEGWYYLTIYGYYYYGYYGPYVLESVPAPKSFRTFCFSPSRLSARSVTSAMVPSRFDVIRERTQAAHLSRYTMCARTTRVNGSRLAIRSVQQRQTPARFNTIKTPTVLVVPGSFSARGPAGASNVSRLVVRSGQQLLIPSRWDQHGVNMAGVASRFNSQVRSSAGSIARHQALTLPGWTIWARNTATGQSTPLGFLPADTPAPQLFDVPLPDGIFEIEVRPSQWLWPDCRGRRVMTLITGNGPGDPPAGLPVIQNLRREIVGGTSIIKWNVAAEASPEAFDFGLWFASTSPVDTSGPPDQIVPYYTAQGEYQVLHAQTSPEAVAVMAFAPTTQGAVAELDLPWDTTSPVSPPDQLAVS